VVVPIALIIEEKVEKMNKLIFGETNLGINWQILIIGTSLEISRLLGVQEVIFRNPCIFRKNSGLVNQTNFAGRTKMVRHQRSHDGIS